MFSFINIHARRAKKISALGLAAISLCPSYSTKCVAAEDDRVTILKRKVGYKAVDDFVCNGMVVGMGTGSTCYFSLDRLDQLLKQHKLKDITVIPCSDFTKKVKIHITALLLIIIIICISNVLLEIFPLQHYHILQLII